MEEKGKIYKTFRGFCVFVFRYRAKNKNAELAESFRNMLYPILKGLAKGFKIY